MFTLGAFSGDNSWVAIEYDRHILRYSTKRVALLLKCYSIVVSAECAHWLRYSYSEVENYCGEPVSIRSYCKKRVRVRRDRIMGGSASAAESAMRTLRGNVNSFIRRCNLHRTLSVVAARALYLAPLSRDKIYVFTCLHAYFIARGTRILLCCIASIHLITPGTGKAACSFAPFISPSIVTPSRFHPPRIRFLLA